MEVLIYFEKDIDIMKTFTDSTGKVIKLKYLDLLF